VESDIRLAELGGSAGSTRSSIENFASTHQHLRSGLADAKLRGYDYVLIDCPPHFNLTTRTALVASDYIIVPSKADYLSMLGISYLKGHHVKLVEQYNTACSEVSAGAPINPTTLGVVFTMVQFINGSPLAIHSNYIAHVRAIGFPIFRTRIRYNATVYGGAGETGVPVVLLGGNGTITDEIVGVANEMLTRIENPDAALANSEGRVA
jgi:chromosome partitioning protein